MHVSTKALVLFLFTSFALVWLLPVGNRAWAFRDRIGQCYPGTQPILQYNKTCENKTYCAYFPCTANHMSDCGPYGQDGYYLATIEQLQTGDGCSTTQYINDCSVCSAGGSICGEVHMWFGYLIFGKCADPCPLSEGVYCGTCKGAY